MNRMHIFDSRISRIIPAFAGIALMAGCVSIPEPLEGNYSEEFYPADAVDRSLGANVRWGGVVVETRPEQNQTCIEILAQALDTRAQPRRSDDDFGRFIACKDEFIDPEIFVNGRQVTAVGRLSEFRDGAVGEFDYRYPVVNADSIYLWPERVYEDTYFHSYPYFHGGFWPYYYGYRFYPYYYRPYPLGNRIHSGGAVNRSGGSAAVQK